MQLKEIRKRTAGGEMQLTEKKEKLNIAMLGHKRIPSREGGIEIVVEELATRMQAMGHQVTCYNRRGHHVCGREYDGKQRDFYQGVRLKSVFTINRKGLAAVTASISGGVCAALGRYNVVHFHGEGPCAMLWLPKLFGKRCIATIHGLDHQRAKWGRLASAYIRMGEKCAVKFADEIIVLSKGTQEYFQKTYKRKTRIIPNGVNRPRIRKAGIIREQYSLEPDQYLLFLGRLVPEKGIQYLIEAFKELATEKKLVIAGGSSDTDEYQEKLRQMAKEDHRIIFTGFVQGEVLEELYSNAYLYVLPSDLEGMPLSLLEAMSYGCCCLVSDIEECAAVIENKGFTFHKGSAVDLKKKLQNLCDEEKMVEECRREASDFICRKYNWDDVVEKTIALYRGGDKYSLSFESMVESN